jgi:hypothetical protein
MKRYEELKMKLCYAMILGLAATTSAHAAGVQPGGVQLLCHRTANEDVPENTLEALEQAALLGCNLVEIDIRRTLDGKLVLNHDGLLERLSDGVGEVETTYYDDLRTRDMGSWMGERFTGMRMASFEDGLRLARERDIRLYLDLKTKGIGPEVLQMLAREGMMQRVQFGGEWEDVKKLYPGANAGNENVVWVWPGVTAEKVKEYHRDGKAVVVNFSLSGHDMDMGMMKAAVAAGADAINVDYPRLGADSVGRPVERTLCTLTAKADAGESSARVEAILQLAKYRGFPKLQGEFARRMLDPDDHVSRAAAVALTTARPHAQVAVFAEALRYGNPVARANAAWALGVLDVPALTLTPLLSDKDPRVLQEVLMALGHIQGEVSAQSLLPLLGNSDTRVRSAAAVALARHHPEVAVVAVPAQLRVEMKTVQTLYTDYERRGKPQLTQAEIDEITSYFKCQIKMMQAISMLRGPAATKALEEQAFRPGADFSQMNGVVAAFQLWDRIGADAIAAVRALASNDARIADGAEWMLI